MKHTVTIEVNTFCNYDCWYCFAHTKKPLERLNKSLIKDIISKIPNNSMIQIIGGEPAFYPELKYLLNELKSLKNCDVYVQTNLSPLAFEKLKEFDCDLAVSYHPQAFFGEFLKYTLKLKHRIKSIDVMFYNTQTLEIAKKFKSIFKNKEVILRPLTPLGAWNNQKLIKRTYELLLEYKTLKTQGPLDIFEPDEIIERKLIQFNPNYKRTECPINAITISHNGEISQCPIHSNDTNKCKFCPLV